MQLADPALRDPQDQADLAQVFTELVRKGAQVVLSNSDTPLVRTLYAGWPMGVIMAPRAVSCKVETRTAVPEILVRWK